MTVVCPRPAFRLKSCAVTASFLALAACGDNSSAPNTQLARQEFTGRFSNEKTTPPETLQKEWVVLDKSGLLMYRYNIHTYCLIIAKGQIDGVFFRGENYVVTYSYQSALTNGDTSKCPADGKTCFEEIADCQKVADLINSHTGTNVVTVPKATKPEDVFSRLKPQRL